MVPLETDFFCWKNTLDVYIIFIPEFDADHEYARISVFACSVQEILASKVWIFPKMVQKLDFFSCDNSYDVYMFFISEYDADNGSARISLFACSVQELWASKVLVFPVKWYL
jgi:hypothetical protein